MSEWGRAPYAGRWIPKGPVATFAALLLALVTTGLLVRYQHGQMTDAQQAALPTYVRSVLFEEVGLPPSTYTIEGQRGRFSNGDVRAFLRLSLFDDLEPWQLFSTALYGGAAVAVLLLIPAMRADMKRARERREGRRLKGPEPVSARTFTRRLRPSLWARVFRRAPDGVRIRQGRLQPSVILPRDLENSHTLIAGDTGTGKSTLIHQYLADVARRGAQ